MPAPFTYEASDSDDADDDDEEPVRARSRHSCCLPVLSIFRTLRRVYLRVRRTASRAPEADGLTKTPVFSAIDKYKVRHFALLIGQ